MEPLRRHTKTGHNDQKQHKKIGNKVIHTLRNRIPTFLMKTVQNAFVISHLHYSLPLIQSIDKNLLISLEKQLN